MWQYSLSGHGTRLLPGDLDRGGGMEQLRNKHGQGTDGVMGPWERVKSESVPKRISCHHATMAGFVLCMPGVSAKQLV
jgi:hypothetical protein